MPTVLHTEYAIFEDGHFEPFDGVSADALCLVNVPDHVTDVEGFINQALAHYNDFEVSAHAG